MLPNGVQFKLGPILVRYRKLYHRGTLKLAKYSGEFSGQVFEEYYNEIIADYKLFTSEGLDYESVYKALRTSMMLYHGRPLTTDLFRDLAWRLAGTNKYILHGTPLASALFVDNRMTWVPLYIEDCELNPAVKFPMLYTEFRICSGLYAGYKFVHQMPHYQLVKIFAKSLGFPKWKHTNYRELVQCGLLALMYSDVDGKALINEVSATPALISHNSSMRSKRRRQCHYDEKCACHNCHRGYEGPDACKYACRRLALIKRKCWKCGEDSWFRPNASETSVCERCRLRSVKSQLITETHR